MSWHDRRYTAAHWDHERDLRKHEPRPQEQRYAVASLVGYCEGLINSGLLGEDIKLALEQRIAITLSAFNMPSSGQGTVQ